MQYFKYLGKPCNLGVHGYVKTGAVLALSDHEAQTVADNKDFKPTRAKDENLQDVLAAQCRDITQESKENLMVLAEQMKDDGYPIILHYGQSQPQLSAMIQRALNQGPEAFTGESRKLYDALYKETDESVIAKGKLAGVEPDPKRHTKREIVAAIVRAKQQFDIDHDNAVAELSSFKPAEDMTDNQKDRMAKLKATAAKVWPLAANVMPEPNPAETPEA